MLFRSFLRGATLCWQEYIAPSATWEHDHCEFCFQTFMEVDHPDVERAGYVTYTPGGAWWICRNCYEDLHEEFGWQVEPPE